MIKRLTLESRFRLKVANCLSHCLGFKPFSTVIKFNDDEIRRGFSPRSKTQAIECGGFRFYLQYYIPESGRNKAKFTLNH